MWPTGDEALEDAKVQMDRSELTALFEEEQSTEGVDFVTSKTKRSSVATRLTPWDLDTDRFKTWEGIEDNAKVLWGWLVRGKGRKLARAIGLVLDADPTHQTIFRASDKSQSLVNLAVEVHSVRRALRRTTRGAIVNDLVVEITQRRRGYADPEVQLAKDSGAPLPNGDRGDFRYRAGCTLLIDPASMKVRRVIRSAGTIADDSELERQRRYLFDGGLRPDNAYVSATDALKTSEPFALLHRHGD